MARAMLPTDRAKQRNWLYLLIVYFLAHGLLLVVSGRWWDDWCMFGISTSTLKDMTLELGRPSSYLLNLFARSMPEMGYRVVTFLMYFLCVLFFYQVLENWLSPGPDKCFWISCVYAVLPVNDVRITLAVFPYTVGLFFFMAGMSLLSGSIPVKAPLPVGRRIGCLVLFLCSFILNSNLCFYLLALLMLLTKEKKLKGLLRYPDFILLPVVYFVGKTLLFPAHGAYNGYNSVTFEKLIRSALYIIPADVTVIARVMENNLKIHPVLLAGIVCVIVFFGVFLFRTKRLPAEPDQSFQSRLTGNSVLMLLGFVALSAGLISYVVVFQTYKLAATGASGRHVMLAPFGMSVLLCGAVFTIFRPNTAKFLLAGMVLCGIVHFNTYYLSYQQDYYRQVSLQYQLEQHDELRSVGNIMYVNLDRGLVHWQPFYQLNAIAELAYDNQTRLILPYIQDNADYELARMDHARTNEPDIRDIGFVGTEGFVDRPQYHMSDYTPGSDHLDAILEHSFSAGLLDVIPLRLREITDSGRFREEIMERTTFSVMTDDTDDYERYLAGMLR